MEVAVPPSPPATPPPSDRGALVPLPPHVPPPHLTRQYAGTKTGDTELEKQVNQRIKDLGLMDNKLIIEKQLANRLDETMGKGDVLVGALKRCRRRQRLNDQINAFSGEVKNIIKQDITRDSNGNKIAYIVSVLMGRFTKDVKYLVEGKEILIMGSSPNGPNLTKEITIEFPHAVDVSLLIVSYSAGVFKMEAPYKRRIDSLSSGGSERRSSLTSEAADSWTSESTGNDPV